MKFATLLSPSGVYMSETPIKKKKKKKKKN